MGLKRQYHNVKVGLAMEDKVRLQEVAKTENKTAGEVAREAIRWYMDNRENLSKDERESEVAQALKYATDQHIKAVRHAADRICKMLARQGTAIGTLYEITWMSLQDDMSRKAFEAAVAAAKQKMRKHVERDELEITAAMKNVIGIQDIQGPQDGVCDQ